jgi:signal peptidase II
MQTSKDIQKTALMNFLREHKIALLVSFAILLLDQMTKNLILKNLAAGMSIPIIQNVFHLTFVQNTGIAFGLFQNSNLFFLCTSLFIMLGIIYVLLQTPKEEKATHIFLGMVLGGAMGNIVDRMFLGYVVDFLDFRFWPIFNVADSAITIAIIGLIIVLWKK